MAAQVNVLTTALIMFCVVPAVSAAACGHVNGMQINVGASCMCSTSCEQCLPPSTDNGDQGWTGNWRGWYDVQGCGQCNDYCRWVGNSGSGGDPGVRTVHSSSYWSCRKAGTDTIYASFDASNIPSYANYYGKPWSVTYMKCNGPDTCIFAPCNSTTGMY